MSHVDSCSESVLTPLEQCDCDCEGSLHGVPNTTRARALFAQPNDRSTFASNRTTEYRRAANRKADDDATWPAAFTAFLGALLTESVIDQWPETQPNHEPAWESPTAILEAVSNSILESLLNEIAAKAMTAGGKDTVSDPDRDKIVERLKSGHGYCVLLSSIVVLYDVTGAVVDAAIAELAGKIADSVVTALFGEAKVLLISGTARACVEAAFTTGAKKILGALTQEDQIDATIKAIQLFAVVTCPDVDAHPAADHAPIGDKDSGDYDSGDDCNPVHQHCLMPLTLALLAAWYQPLIQNFIGARVPTATKVDKLSAPNP
jgi:hypothetical protein